MGVVDSQNKTPGGTNNNTNNLNSLQCTVSEKLRKPQITFFSKLTVFVGFP